METVKGLETVAPAAGDVMTRDRVGAVWATARSGVNGPARPKPAANNAIADHVLKAILILL